jgi:hypothetical protein
MIEGTTMMEKIDWLAYQQDVESAFWLDCSEEDLKTDEQARKLYRQLKQQRTYIEQIDKLSNKILYPRTESWIF